MVRRRIALETCRLVVMVMVVVAVITRATCMSSFQVAVLMTSDGVSKEELVPEVMF